MTADERSEVEVARAELIGTLGAIEAKLNVPKRAKASARRARERFGRMRDESPIAFTGVLAGAATAVGGAAWLVVRAVRK